MAINNIPNLFQSTVPGTASMPITYDSTPSLLNIDQAQIQQAINQKKIDEEQQQRKRLDQQRKLQNLADTFRMINANKSGNVGAGNVIADRIAQRKALFEENKNMQEAFKNNPELLKIYNTFGKGAAFQESQRLRNAEINAAQQKRQIEGLKEAGFSNREINLFVNAGMKADDILALRDQGSSGQSLDEIKNKVNLERSTQDEVTGKAPADDLANLNEAHGSILPGGDAFQENVINTVARKVFGSEPADETGAAVRAKTELDERILQVTTQNYSGRPSVFLLEQIKKLIPPVNTSDKDAFESYSKIETRVRGYLQDLEREIQSGQFKGEKLESMKSDFRELYGLQQDLETAKKGLGDFQADIKPNLDNQSSGNYDNVYLNDTK